MRLLILGGTVFLGRHIVTAASERGHELTLFNRGRSEPEPVRGVEQIHGDREHDLALLAGHSWDAVIDTSGYLPRVVRASAERLADSVERYLFVSSISAYGTFPRPGIGEHVAAAPSPPPEEEDIENRYGELKAACERAVEAVLPGRTAVVRPGLIVGPHDPTERFTYWVRRLADAGRVLAPRAPDQPVQLIDARDLAAGLTFRPLEWTVLDTLAWVRRRPSPPTPSALPRPAGMAPERERELLERLAA